MSDNQALIADVERALQATHRHLEATYRKVDDLQSCLKAAEAQANEIRLATEQARRIANPRPDLLAGATDYMPGLRSRLAEASQASEDITSHMVAAASRLSDAQHSLSRLDEHDPRQHLAADEILRLRHRTDRLEDLVDAARPLALSATTHVHNARQEIATAGLVDLAPGRQNHEAFRLDNRIHHSDRAIGRAQESTHHLDNLVARATTSASTAAGYAGLVSEETRRRVTRAQREDIAAPSPNTPTITR